MQRTATVKSMSAQLLGPRSDSGCPFVLLVFSVPAAFGTASVRGGAVGKPLQLDEFQSQRLDPRDEAVQRGSVGQPTHQQGVACRRMRFKWFERLQQPAVSLPAIRKVYSALTTVSLWVRTPPQPSSEPQGDSDTS